MMKGNTAERLFHEDWHDAFEQGASKQLVQNRNRFLANLLNSDRRFYYIQILYRMLRFRREYEMEPLNEEIYESVVPAQESIGGEYTNELFNQDISQLTEWEIVTCRIEKERLRGYRDTSRNKYRYCLTEDAIAFMGWLEERLRDDLQENVEDTRNLLADVNDRLYETTRHLKSFKPSEKSNLKVENEARKLLYQIHQLYNLTEQINQRLVSLNASLLSFLLHSYEAREAKEIINELNHYLHSYLTQIDQMRITIVPGLESLRSDANRRKLDFCAESVEEERRRMPHLLGNNPAAFRPDQIVEGLRNFFRESGRLDALRRRIGDSAMKVWGKLSAHLRELDRKNNRLQDLRARIGELAKLPEQTVPVKFFRELLSPAQMLSDPHYWDEFEKANPPEPRKEAERRHRDNKRFIAPKQAFSGKVRTIEESRLTELQDWIGHTFPHHEKAFMVTEGRFEGFDDMTRIIDLAKNGILGHGRKLNKIGYSLSVSNRMETLTVEDRQLTFYDMELSDQTH